MDYTEISGPNPSTLGTTNTVPESIEATSMRITYTSNTVTDYINLKTTGRQLIIELADPLFGLIRKSAKVTELAAEINDVLAAIRVTGIKEHLKQVVAEYFNEIVGVAALKTQITLGLVAYILKKLHESGELRLSYIYQADIAELPSWIGLIQEAKKKQGITVTQGQSRTFNSQ